MVARRLLPRDADPREALRGLQGAGEASLTGRALLFPSEPRHIPGHRWIGVVLRTAHLITVGTLLGGHVFDVDPTRLVPFLFGAITTGAAMITLECAATCAWLGMTKGVCAVGKLAVLGAIPLFWDARVPLLVAVTVIAGVSSHMPARYRHYPLLAARVVTPVITAAGRARDDAR